MGSAANHFTRVGVFASLAALVLIFATTSSSDAQVPTLSPGSGRIVSLTGQISVRRGTAPAQLLKLHETVQAGDEIITGSNSEAVIQTSDGSTVRVFPDSRVIFSEGSPGIQGFLHLFLGSIKVHIEKLSGRPNPHTMTTPTAVIAVRGTTYSVLVDETDATLVAVDEGVVAVSNVRLPSREMLLHRGQKTWVRTGQPPMRAARFRGPSEHADMMTGHGNMGAQGGGMGSAGMGQGLGLGSRRLGAINGRHGGQPH